MVRASPHWWDFSRKEEQDMEKEWWEEKEDYVREWMLLELVKAECLEKLVQDNLEGR